MHVVIGSAPLQGAGAELRAGEQAPIFHLRQEGQTKEVSWLLAWPRRICRWEWKEWKEGMLAYSGPHLMLLRTYLSWQRPAPEGRHV